MLSIIAAFSKYNHAIGNNGRIPWDLPGERFYFKEITLNSTVIMGRKTWQSIGRPLPNRFNIVISNTENFQGENLMTVKSLDEAINEAEKHGYEKIFVIGGENVYKDALPLAEKLYLTEVDFEIPDADAFFPEFSEEAYILESESTTQTENGIKYRKKIYTKTY